MLNTLLTQNGRAVGAIAAVGVLVGSQVIPSPSSAQNLSGTLKKIKDSGEIVLGVRESSIPFSYLDNNEKAVGYSIDLCMKVVDAVKKELKMPNLKVKTNPVTSQTRIPLMTNGTIDLECGSTTNSKERQKQVDFSVAHYVTSVRMAVKADSGIKNLDDLNGKAVVTTTGTTSDRHIKQNERGKNINVKNLYGKDHAESFLMLETGRAQAFVMDDVLLAGLIAQSKNPKAFAIVGHLWPLGSFRLSSQSSLSNPNSLDSSRPDPNRRLFPPRYSLSGDRRPDSPSSLSLFFPTGFSPGTHGNRSTFLGSRNRTPGPKPRTQFPDPRSFPRTIAARNH